MFDIADGWGLDVEVGSHWLFVTVRCKRGHTWETPPLAEFVWDIADELSTNQIILELSEVEVLHSLLIGQLILLHKRITSHGGIVRLAGLSPQNQMALDIANLGKRFPWYQTCEEAMRGKSTKIRVR
jgi:anti-anti-sigma factor